MPETTRSLADLDFVGGDPSLDFANTINSRLGPGHDYLASYEDLCNWAVLAGIRAPSRRPDEQATVWVLRRAHRLRDAIYRTFSAIAASTQPPAAETRRILRAFGAATARGSLELADRAPTLTWPASDAPSALLDPIAFAAGELLLAADRPPVKECSGCGWLFLDRSRNSSRRWCDMQTCGSREKMRRYHRARRSTDAADVRPGRPRTPPAASRRRSFPS